MTTLRWGEAQPAWPREETRVPPTGRLTFTVQWLPADDDLMLAAKVFAHLDGEAAKITEHHIGDIHFNGNEWMFIRIDRDGEQVMDGLHYIPVDPDAEAEFRAEHGRILANAEEGPVDASLAFYQVKRRQHRDESRELAEIGGKMQAKRWWYGGFWTTCPCGFDSPRFGAEHNVGCPYYCTGYIDPGTGQLRHDGESCPAHEAATS